MAVFAEHLPRRFFLKLSEKVISMSASCNSTHDNLASPQPLAPYSIKVSGFGQLGGSFSARLMPPSQGFKVSGLGFRV